MDAFGALADPVRRRLLERLSRGPARVVDLAVEHPVSRPAISRHLRLLGEAGLVSATDLGRERHYRMEPGALRQVTDLVELLTPRPPVPENALDALETEVHRTSRQRRNLEESA